MMPVWDRTHCPHEWQLKAMPLPNASHFAIIFLIIVSHLYLLKYCRHQVCLALATLTENLTSKAVRVSHS
jgi:hypothetical protein